MKKQCIFKNKNCKGKIIKSKFNNQYLCSYHNSTSNALESLLTMSMKRGYELGRKIERISIKNKYRLVRKNK